MISRVKHDHIHEITKEKDFFKCRFQGEKPIRYTT